MEDECPLVMSPLCQSVTDKGLTVHFHIYRGLDSDWILEVVDEFNNSTVWDDLFATDQLAFEEGMRTIREEGIECLIGPPE
jgi:hypothetical protein